ncbi:hypothetical protein ACWEPN_14095 [Nonomuraea wenchangensis]|uniref:hypothetical protein n=1 Tax=Nonomuraea sp. LP-02 TaxID=3097960 RepID=UPI003FA5B0B4
MADEFGVTRPTIYRHLTKGPPSRDYDSAGRQAVIGHVDDSLFRRRTARWVLARSR